jgi:hypothetical protein
VGTPTLRFAPLRCPKPSSASTPAGLQRAHNTRRYEHPFAGGSGPIGPRPSELSRRRELPVYGVLRSSSHSGYVSRSVGRESFELPPHDPTIERLPYGRCTWTLTQLVPASLLASTMQMSLPLPPLAVSSLSPSATSILSKPPPPLTTSVSEVFVGQDQVVAAERDDLVVLAVAYAL